MASATDPTVPLPTATDVDDDDDDDDDVSPPLPPAATPPPAQPTVAPAPAPPPVETAVPDATNGVPATTTAPGAAPSDSSVGSNTIRPSSATGLTESRPSGSPAGLNPAGSANDSSSGGGELGKGASAGIGIGVTLVVCLAAFGMWFFLRRRKARRHKALLISSRSSDEEHAPKPPMPEVYAYRAGGAVEVSGDEKPGRWNELESPTYVAEVGHDQVFRAELPGSDVPTATAGKKGDERLFADAPIDGVDEPSDARGWTVDKKTDERLFSDPPIDEGTDTLELEKLPRPIGDKDHLR